MPGHSAAPTAFSIFWDDSAVWAVQGADEAAGSWSAKVSAEEVARVARSLPQGLAGDELVARIFRGAQWKRSPAGGDDWADPNLSPRAQPPLQPEDDHSGGELAGENDDGARDERRDTADAAARGQFLPAGMSEPGFLYAVFPGPEGPAQRPYVFAVTVWNEGRSSILVHASAHPGWTALRMRMVNTATGRIHEHDVSASEVWAAAQAQRGAGPALWRRLCAQAWVTCEGLALQHEERRARGRAQGFAVAQSLSRAQSRRDAERRTREDLELMRKIGAQAARESARNSDDAALYANLVLQRLHPRTAGYSFTLPNGGSMATTCVASGPKAGEVTVTVAALERSAGGDGEERTFVVRPEAAVRAAARACTFRPEVYSLMARDPSLLQPFSAGTHAPHPLCRVLNRWIRAHGRALRRVVRNPDAAATEREDPSIRPLLAPNHLLHRRRSMFLTTLPAGHRSADDAQHAARAHTSAQRAHALAVAALGGRTRVAMGSLIIEVVNSSAEGSRRPRAVVALVQGPALPGRRGAVTVDADAFANVCISAPHASPQARLLHGTSLCLAQVARTRLPPPLDSSSDDDDGAGSDDGERREKKSKPPLPPGEGIHCPLSIRAVPWRRRIFSGMKAPRGLGLCRVVCTVDEKMRRVEVVVEVQDSESARFLVLHRPLHHVTQGLKSPRILQRRFRTAFGHALAAALVVTDDLDDPAGALDLDAEALNEAADREMANTERAGTGVPHKLRRTLSIDAPKPRAPSRTGRRHRAAASVIGIRVDGKRAAPRAERPVETLRPLRDQDRALAAARRILRAVRELRQAHMDDRPPHLGPGLGCLLARRTSFIPDYGCCLLQALAPAGNGPVRVLLVTCTLAAEDSTRSPEQRQPPRRLWRLWPMSSVAPGAVGRSAPGIRDRVQRFLGRVDVCLPHLAPRLVLRGADDMRVARWVKLHGVQEARVVVHFGTRNGAVQVTAARDRPPILKAAGSCTNAQALTPNLRVALEEGRGQPACVRYILSRMAVVRDPETRRWRIQLNCDPAEREGAMRDMRLHYRRVTTEGRHEAATTLQAAFRGFLVRQGLREVSQAAATVQALFRGAHARIERRRRLEAASSMQRYFRRQLVQRDSIRRRAAAHVLSRTMRRAARVLARRRASLASILLARWFQGRIAHRQVMALFPLLADRTAFVRGVGPCRVRAFLDRSMDDIVFSCRKPRQERVTTGSPPDGTAKPQQSSPNWEGGVLIRRVVLAPIRQAVPDLRVGSVLEKYIAAYLSRNLALDGAGDIVVRDDAMRLLRSHALRATAGIDGADADAGTHSVLDRIVAQGHMDEAKARARPRATNLEAFGRERRRKHHLRRVERVYKTALRSHDALLPREGGGRSVAPDYRLPLGPGSMAPSVSQGGWSSRVHSRDGTGSKGTYTTDRRRPRSVSSPRLGDENDHRRTLAAVKAPPMRHAAAPAPAAGRGSARDSWLQLDPERVHRLEKRSYEEMLRQRQARRQAKRNALAGSMPWPDASEAEDRRKPGHSLAAPSESNGTEPSSGSLLPSPELLAHGRLSPKQKQSSGARRRPPATATLKELEAALSLPHSVPTKELMMLVRRAAVALSLVHSMLTLLAPLAGCPSPRGLRCAEKLSTACARSGCAERGLQQRTRHSLMNKQVPSQEGTWPDHRYLAPPSLARMLLGAAAST